MVKGQDVEHDTDGSLSLKPKCVYTLLFVYLRSRRCPKVIKHEALTLVKFSKNNMDLSSLSEEQETQEKRIKP
jgi:hypothetical protein